MFQGSKILGIASLIRNNSRLTGRLSKDISRAVKEAAAIIESEAKIALTREPTRAIRTGNLRRSVNLVSLRPFTARVAPTANYALFVHEGTIHMRSRPYMQVAIQEATAVIEDIFDGAVETSIKKSYRI